MGTSKDPTSVISLECKGLSASRPFASLLKSASLEYFGNEISPENFRDSIIDTAIHPNCLFALFSHRGESNLELATVQKTPFDTEIFGFPCGKVTALAKLSDDTSYNDHLSLYKSMLAKVRESGLEYLIARVLAGHWQRIHALEDCGFKLIDGISLFTRALKEVEYQSSEKIPQLKILEAPDSFDRQLAQIARDSFTKSRFHNDQIIPAQAAAKIHEQWALNCLHKKVADILLVAEIDGKAAGFVTVRLNRKPIEVARSCTAIIDLIAVSPTFAGHGVGTALVNAALSWAKAHGADHLDVQTQTDNYSAQALYNRCGFKVAGQFFTFRWSSRSDL